VANEVGRHKRLGKQSYLITDTILERRGSIRKKPGVPASENAQVSKVAQQAEFTQSDDGCKNAQLLTSDQ